MISKIVRFINSKKKTISEKTIWETMDILKAISENNVNTFNEETFIILEEIKERLTYLNDNNYEDQGLNSLNGIVIEFIKKYLNNGKISTKTNIKLYETLNNYKNHVDKILLELKIEINYYNKQ